MRGTRKKGHVEGKRSKTKRRKKKKKEKEKEKEEEKEEENHGEQKKQEKMLESSDTIFDSMASNGPTSMALPAPKAWVAS